LFTVSDTIHVNAPIDRCFLLSTHIGLVEQTLEMRLLQSTAKTGLVVAGDRVVWVGWRFGLPQVHESLITKYDRPVHFQDTMQRGRFKRFQHDHYFAEIDGYTLLTDKLRFSMPLGYPGRLAGKRLLLPHIAQLLRRRLELLKHVAENGDWREYLAGVQLEPLERGVGADIVAGAGFGSKSVPKLQVK
jgi:ligand-binding SRPBCC domain-containing protein